jgi:lysophospholipase L1-like esterase
LGTNDLKNRFSVSATDIALSICRLVRVARQCDHHLMGPAPEILVVVPPPLTDLDESHSKGILLGGEEKSRQLAAELKPLSEDFKFRMLDAGELIECSPVDGIHWEPEEHQKLAIEVSKVVKEMIG